MSKPTGAKPFILVCRECGDGANGKPIYFESQEARGRWASEHARETGHERWLVTSTDDLGSYCQQNEDSLRFGITCLRQVVPPLAASFNEVLLAAAITGTEPPITTTEYGRWMAVFAELDDLLKGG